MPHLVNLQWDQSATQTTLSTPSVQGIRPCGYQWSAPPGNIRCALTQQVGPPPLHLLCSDGPVMLHESKETAAQ